LFFATAAIDQAQDSRRLGNGKGTSANASIASHRSNYFHSGSRRQHTSRAATIEYLLDFSFPCQIMNRQVWLVDEVAAAINTTYPKWMVLPRKKKKKMMEGEMR
jgi:hypothetical protein